MLSVASGLIVCVCIICGGVGDELCYTAMLCVTVSLSFVVVKLLTVVSCIC